LHQEATSRNRRTMPQRPKVGSPQPERRVSAPQPPGSPHIQRGRGHHPVGHDYQPGKAGSNVGGWGYFAPSTLEAAEDRSRALDPEPWREPARSQSSRPRPALTQWAPQHPPRTHRHPHRRSARSAASPRVGAARSVRSLGTEAARPRRPRRGCCPDGR